MRPTTPHAPSLRALAIAGVLVASSLGAAVAPFATKPVAAADPLTCTGYPEPRVFLEGEAWWRPAGSTRPRRHVHLGTCWPAGQTVSGRLALDIRIALDHQPAGTRLAALRIAGATSSTLRTVRLGLPVSRGKLATWVHTTIDTTLLHDGINELRLTARVRHPNGTVASESARWLLALDNGNPASDDHRAGWGAANVSIHGGPRAAVARFAAPIPLRPLAGTWTFPVRLHRGAHSALVTRHLVTIDPDFHAGVSGTVIKRGTGGFSGPLSVDTTRLADGPHRLVLVTTQRYSGTGPDGANSSVQVIPFRVANGGAVQGSAKTSLKPAASPTPTPRPSATPAPTPTPRPSATPAPTQAAVAGLPLPEGAATRPYTADGPWNTKIPANPVLDPNSAAWIAGVGPLTSNTASYTYPVYTVHGSTTPKVTYTASGTAAVISPDGATKTSAPNKQIAIPMPESAIASAGSDGQIIVIDLDSGDEYDLWQVDTARRTVTNMTKFQRGFLSAGTTSVVYPSRGAGIVYYGGLIRPWEIKQGRIDHALAFAYNKVSPAFRYPATKSDGAYGGLPEGARIQLNPAFDVNTLSDPTARIVARALQVYGAYVIDYAGNGGKIYAEDQATAHWGTSGVPALTTSTISAIPAAQLRVLRRWDGG